MVDSSFLLSFTFRRVLTSDGSEAEESINVESLKPVIDAVSVPILPNLECLLVLCAWRLECRFTRCEADQAGFVTHEGLQRRYLVQ